MSKVREPRDGALGRLVVGLLVAASLAIAGCSSNSSSAIPTAPTAPASALPLSDVTTGNTTSVVDERPNGTAAVATAAVTTNSATPFTISGYSDYNVGITNGVVSMDCGGSYNGYRAVNDATGIFWWSISGPNFGNQKGTATLGGQSVNIISWSASTVRIDPTVPWSSGPMSTMLKVRTASGVEYSQGVQIVPAIQTRIFGQCTYHVARRRKEMGLQPSPSAYGSYRAIDRSYVPRRGDQYQWNTALGKHTAILESVSGPIVKNGVSTYTLTVSEMNMDCRNGTRQFTTTFAVNGNSITTPLKHPSLGNTLLYYR